MIATALFLLLLSGLNVLLCSACHCLLCDSLLFCVYFSISVVEIERVMLNKHVAYTDPSAKKV